MSLDLNAPPIFPQIIFRVGLPYYFLLALLYFSYKIQGLYALTPTFWDPRHLNYDE